MLEESPRLSHLPSEFLCWTWYATERGLGSLDLGAAGRVDLWVDDRLAFRTEMDEKPRTVITGENPSVAPEARAALAGGKLLGELRLGLRREDREYEFTLSGESLDLSRVKLPQMIKGGGEEELQERMYLYEELHYLLRSLLRRFAEERTAQTWHEETLPGMRAWIQSPPG